MWVQCLYPEDPCAEASDGAISQSTIRIKLPYYTVLLALQTTSLDLTVVTLRSTDNGLIKFSHNSRRSSNTPPVSLSLVSPSSAFTFKLEQEP